MPPRLPSIRAEIPFAASGPLHRVHTSAVPLLDDFLKRHGYTRIDLDGSRMETRVAMHAELAEVMAFPEWYGANWDAFNDCFGGFLHAHAGTILAIVIHDADRLDPSAAFELGVATFGMETRFLDEMPLHVFAIGDSSDYGRAE